MILKNSNQNQFEIAQCDAHAFNVSIFKSEKFDYQFRVSLQPDPKSELILPWFQPTKNKEIITPEVENKLNEISDFIKKKYYPTHE